MKKNYITIIMTLTIAILIFNLINVKLNYSEQIQDIKTQFMEDSLIISNLSKQIKLMYENDNFIINKSSVLIKENGDSIEIKNINFDQYLFVIRFSEFSCLSCVSSEMKHVSEFIESYQNVLCLATFSRLEDLVSNKRMLNLTHQVYNTPANFFRNGIEEQKLPYYFLMDKEYRISHLFIPDPQNKELTDNYLKYIYSFINN